MLTGDKIETAMNIGHACKLLDSEMNMFVLKSLDKAEVHDDIQRSKKDQKAATHRDNAVVVAGETLSLIQLDKSL